MMAERPVGDESGIEEFRQGEGTSKIRRASYRRCHIPLLIALRCFDGNETSSRRPLNLILLAGYMEYSKSQTGLELT